MSLLIKLIINSIAVWVSAYLLSAYVTIDSWQTTVIVAVVLGIVNMFVKPILQIISFPINILTLGLFSFVINGLMIMLVSGLVPGFEVAGFLWAIIFSILLSIVSTVLSSLSK